MSLVALLRGVNVGGHRTFRPTALARALAAYDVVNIGAAGTFVVRNPGDPALFRAAIAEQLPFATDIVLREGDEVLRLVAREPFGQAPPEPDVVRFASFLTGDVRVQPPLPLAFPPEGPWLVRIVALEDGVAFGEYRRHMRTIGHLAQVDRVFGVTVTTRNWNTVMAIARVLQGLTRPARATS